MTLRFISNHSEFSFYQCRKEKSMVSTDICPNDFCEDWDHIWTCETNEIEIDSLIKKSICEYEKKLSDEKKNDELNILNKIVLSLLKF